VRIGLVSQQYPPETGGGGIGTQTLAKARGLSSRGHEVHVVTASWDGQERVYDDAGAFIHRIPEPQVELPGYEQSTYWLAYSMAVAGYLHRLAAAVGFDVVQFPEYGGEGFVYQTETFNRRRARYVVQLHGPLAMFAEHVGWPEPGSPLLAVGCFMERTSMHFSDLVLASSRSTAELCARTYDYPLDRIQVVYSGVDTTAFVPSPRPTNGAHPRILFVGRFAGDKGAYDVARAVCSLRDRYPAIRLRAVGKGDERDRSRLMREMAGAEKHLEIVGYAPYEEMVEHYAWCDMLVAPSTFEGGPGNVYLEAMSCGRPVVASSAGGAPEAVLSEATGLLVPPHDVNAIADAITRLTEEEGLGERLGVEARRWTERQFSMERYIDRVESLYLELVQRG
jgi:glycosyltransferase involved in cell wall biosynthesis